MPTDTTADNWLQTTSAVAGAKMTAMASKLLKMGSGTSLPGKVALKLSPNLLATLGQQINTVITVTGTNGKTTTCGLLAQLLSTAGNRVVHNQLGANMVPGITAALACQSSLCGKINAAYGVIEADEASIAGLSKALSIDHVLVTNLFRDQLDRYGELDTTAKMIARGIGQSKIATQQGTLMLNADDPLVTALGKETPSTLYYGIDAVQYGQQGETPVLDTLDTMVPFTKEVTDCPHCGASLQYTHTLFGHLGHYQCEGCGFHRPTVNVLARQVTLYPDKSVIALQVGSEAAEITLPLPGLFNVYNVLAAVCVFLYAQQPVQPGIPPKPISLVDNLATIQTAITQYHGVFGRAEKRQVQGKPVMTMLIKNPTGASEVLKMVAADPQARVMVALNDNYADGRDVSWIWDAQFEYLAQVARPNNPIVVSGVRADDMATRLKYAGVPVSQLVIEPNLKTAMGLALSHSSANETLYVLPTYTALLQLKEHRLG